MTVRLLVFRDRLVGIAPSLFYKGKEYPISVSGLSVGKVGFSGSSAAGKVYNLKTLAEFLTRPLRRGGYWHDCCRRTFTCGDQKPERRAGLPSFH